MTHSPAGSVLRATMVVLLGAGSLGACANDVTFGGSADDDGTSGGCDAPPPPADGWCPPAWTCIGGEWIDTAGACPKPACPDLEPASGSACPVEGQTCQYEYDEEVPCGDEWGYTVFVECFEGTWTHLDTYCQPEPVCPDEAPVDGTDCTGWDEAYFCSWSIETSCGPDYIDGFCEYVGDQMIWNTSYYGEPNSCDDGCAAYQGEAGCAADTACRWLVPGCDTSGPDDLTEAGCFPVEDCSTGSCGDGQTCQTIHYDPCHNQLCEACAAEGAVCK